MWMPNLGAKVGVLYVNKSIIFNFFYVLIGRVSLRPYTFYRLRLCHKETMKHSVMCMIFAWILRVRQGGGTGDSVE